MTVTPDGPEPSGGGLINWFAQNLVAANLLMAFFLLGGWVIVQNMNTEVFPTIDPRTISVTVAYPGATPSEVEQSITRRVEEAVLGLEGVKRVRSIAAENSGSIILELNDFVDEQLVKDKVQTAVDQIADFPPGDAEQPEVTITEVFGGVVRVVVTGDVGALALRKEAEAIERRLLALDDVSAVTIQGAKPYEIALEISGATLREYGLSIDTVASAIRASSVNLSGGVLRTDSGEILLRTDAEARQAQDFENIIISSDNQGRRILLKDIARIVDGFEEGDLENSYNDQPAVFLQVDKSVDDDIFEVESAVTAFVSDYKPSPGISVFLANNQTTIVQQRIGLLTRNAILGLALVFIFLSFTLDLRLAFWTSLGIPISFLGGFLLFGQIITINMVTLFALIIVLGIVVDDAIVVGENIFEEQEQKGVSYGSAISGTKSVFSPVLVGVMTTMAAFAPLLFSSGTLGQIMGNVPIVVIGVLFVSLVEAFLILPAHLAHGTEWSVGIMKRGKQRVQNAILRFRDTVVMPVVELAAKWRYATIAVGVGILIITVGLFNGGHIRFIFFPDIPSDRVTVTLTMPDGTSYAQTEAAMRRIEAGALEAVGGADSDMIEAITSTIGGRLSSGFRVGSGTSLASNVGTARITLTTEAQNDIGAMEIERRWREAVGPIAGAESLAYNSQGFDSGADVSFDLSHVNSDRLLDHANRLRVELEKIDGVYGVESGADLGKRQLEFELTAAGSAAGLSVQELARQVRQSFFGEEVQRIQRRGDEVRVYVRFPRDERSSLSDLRSLRIRLPAGGYAPLSTMATVQESRSFSAINGIDGRRVIGIEANVDTNIATPEDVNKTIREQILDPWVTEDPDFSYELGGDATSQQQDLDSLLSNLNIALMLMFVMLASVLRSYIQPLVILAAIPFGAVGAILGHMLLGYDLSFVSLFGMVALSGVVVNDSVVLIDYYNKLRAQGMDVGEAVIAASRRRFRPIMLTTATTFIGLAPMIAETSRQAQFLVPMAVSLGFGIVFASFIILMLVPALLLIIDDVKKLKFPERRELANQTA